MEHVLDRMGGTNHFRQQLVSGGSSPGSVISVEG